MTCSGCSGAVERVLGRMKDKGKCEQLPMCEWVCEGIWIAIVQKYTLEFY